MTLVSTGELLSTVTRVLTGAGAEAGSAAVTAQAIVYAESSGVRSHGVVRAGPLADQVASGKINGKARFDPVVVGESVRLVDANFGLGYAAATVATDAVLEILGGCAVAVAAVSRSHHFGMAGYYTERIAEAGFVGVALSSTFGAIAPIGGKAALLGNPPISVAAPRHGAPPVVLDLAPAVVARGNIAAKAGSGEPIPPGWAKDEHGQPTIDAQAAMHGTLNAIGGDKGVVLAMLADVLIAALTVSCLPGQASSVFTADGPPPQLGHLILGFDPGQFGVDTGTKIAAYVDSLTGDGAGMRVPGERRRIARRAATIEGVEVDPKVWHDLRRRADSSTLDW